MLIEFKTLIKIIVSAFKFNHDHFISKGKIHVACEIFFQSIFIFKGKKYIAHTVG